MGRTLRGPVARPIFLTSFAQFQNTFGGLWQPSPLGYAVEQFFDNGGCEAVVVRVVNGARPSTLTLAAGVHTLRLRAVRPGTREFLRASVDYDNVPADCPLEFNLTLQRVGLRGTEQVEYQEIFPRVSTQLESDRFVGRVLADSQLACVTGVVPADRPCQTLDSASGLATRYVSSNADGDDGAPLTDYDLIGSEVEGTGLFALDSHDYFNLLCIPPLSRDQDVGPSLLTVAARFCKDRRALLIVDPPASWLTAEDAVRGMRQWNLSSENALMYFPRILAHDKLRGHFESFASGGAVAGMLARSDETFPVWGKARNEEAGLRPGFRPSCLVTEDLRRRLASLGVNTLQAVRSAARPGASPRTLAAGSAGASDWQSLTSRRLALFILNSIERGTRWVIHTSWQIESAALAAGQVRRFFEHLHESGAFGDRLREDSFFVICDGRVHSRPHAESNEFNLVVGFAVSRERECQCFQIVHSPLRSSVVPMSLSRLPSAQYSPEEIQWVDKLAAQLRA